MSDLGDARMDKRHFSTVSLHDGADEKTFWLTQTPEARLEAAELLRQIAYGYDPSAEGLQRLFETADREPD